MISLAAMDLAAKFEDAQKRVKELKEAPSNDDLLQLYAFTSKRPPAT